MDILLIIVIIIIGVLLIFVEFFFIPGFSVFSILGGIVAGVGVYLTYQNYGQTAGNWALAGSIVLTGIILYWGYRRLRSKKWALHTSIDGKVNNENISAYKIGDMGKTITNLRPEGKAIFTGEEHITIYSIGNFIDKGADVQIVQIQGNKIFVKQINH
ncbi:MAG: NfeD family protein [Chitinophagales bacterium]